MILVTGATGLLGTHVMLELLARGKKIRALRRETSNLEQVRKVFRYYLGEKGDNQFDTIEWVVGNVNDVESLHEAVQGCSAVFHCAAIVSFRRRDFKKLIKVNKEGTANVVNSCLLNQIDHLVHVSSTAALGRVENKTVYDEKNKWVTSSANSGYAVSKYLAEMEVWRGAEEGLNVCVVNPSVIIGPGDWNESSVSIFRIIKKGLRFYTRGANAFVDARDVATIMAELSERRIFGQRYLTISENLSFRDLFKLIAAGFGVKAPGTEAKPWMAALVWRLESLLALFGRKQNITRETARSAMAVTQYSNEKIKSEINFEFIPIEKAVQNTVRFFS